MTELEAVNMLLKAIGTRRVNSVDNQQPKVLSAKEILDRARNKIQFRGWWFNIKYNVPYTPDPITKRVTLGDTIHSIVFETPYVTKRGTFAFDRANNTYQFECDLMGYRQIELLEWTELPSNVQQYIAYIAAAEFVRDEIEDLKKEQVYKIDAGLLMIDIKKQDLEEGRYNVFENKRVQQARAGVQPYSRNNKRFHGDPDV
tara:strand:+ start:25 stop:627 length:603 start_codon:yes stop_codon:yes gene_type:complete